MTRQELVELLYQEPQPLMLIKDKVLNLTEIESCTKKLPDKDGEYLIYHTTYGWCLYGFTVGDKWGTDDEVVRRDGTKMNKVSQWASLEFLEK